MVPAGRNCNITILPRMDRETPTKVLHQTEKNRSLPSTLFEMLNYTTLVLLMLWTGVQEF